MADKPVHPQYSDQLENWELCRDSNDGERAVKAAGEKYLPMTAGQIADGSKRGGNNEGALAYAAYKTRAVYPEIYAEAVEAALGIMHRKPPVIEVPKSLEPMLKDATRMSEPLSVVLRNINARQLVTGRLGVVGDIIVDGTDVWPIVALYEDVSVLNWDTNDTAGLRFVILDESKYMLGNDFNWSKDEKYRVLALVKKDTAEFDDSGVYGTAQMEPGDEISALAFTHPNIRGNTLDQIPFSFVNAADIAPEPNKPPFLGLANACMTIYRGEADYRQNLFMQGQDTLVTIGSMLDEDEKVRTGAGARIDLQQGGDAKYIGVSSNGLPEQRQALENDYERAMVKAGQTLNSGKAKESGEALKIRIAAQTATLPQVARAGAAALERVLRVMATWYGENPDDVIVQPNLEFTEEDLNGQTLVQILQAKGLGAPLSDESIHDYMREKGITKRTYEEEVELLGNEEPGAL